MASLCTVGGSVGAHRELSTAPGPPSLAQADDLQVLPKFVLDPLAALQLGVHEQGPALGAAEDGSVLGGSAVTGQPLVVPGSHVGRVREEAEGVQVRGDGDGHLHRGAVGCLAPEVWEPPGWWAWGKALWDGTCGLAPSVHLGKAPSASPEAQPCTSW